MSNHENARPESAKADSQQRMVGRPRRADVLWVVVYDCGDEYGTHESPKLKARCPICGGARLERVIKTTEFR